MANVDEVYLKQFGKNLARIRKSRGLTQQDLANSLGISHASITFIETGKRWPRPSTLHRLAGSLGVTVGQFFEQ